MTAPPVEQLDFLTPPATVRERLAFSEAMAPAPEKRRAVETAIERHIRQQRAWGATRHEVELLFGLKTQTACWRFRELEKAGRIAKSERKREGCTVYVARI